jgi:prepilin-type processing-associated H-X9-DG protein
MTDGTSNTIMTAECVKDLGPWVAGGRATIRALTQKPYIEGPDGLGGQHEGGCQVGLADGSVRYISKSIDPSVMEALSTIAGGETIKFPEP